MANLEETAQSWGGLKVIGAGFGRTGTLSLRQALEDLGFRPCYHMQVVGNTPGATEQWADIAREAPGGVQVDWNAVFTGFQATVDWPACAVYRQLMQAYPDAKVLLSVRDPEKWYQSVLSTIYPSSRRDPSSLHAQMIDAIIWQGTFEGRFEEKDYAIDVFLRHSEEVKQSVPPEKLLVYDVNQGWEPLCAFLGVDVPAGKPFPHLNDRESFIARMQQ